MVLAVVLLSIDITAVLAQDGPGREIVVAQNGVFRGFNPFAPLQRLFGSKEKRPVQRQQEQPVQQRKQRVTRPAGTPPKFEIVEKDPDAGVILVVGDRMARGVADGLKFTLSEKAADPCRGDHRGQGGLHRRKTSLTGRPRCFPRSAAGRMCRPSW
ncbi:hypothetical protein QW131_20405 [Roseibium salinum]|nr:hypothetical protein [Roseibium salinum]